ncbi:MAG TPA: transglycosylase domain-containing protein, partial [Terricaulis sp.]|nr:transglycosylase domain-containing protein [Terricaulis sp.]
QGGSTITQQLARNLFLTPRQTINRKLREMVLASRIERRLTKDEILELYLNRVYLGDQAYGIDAAARRFFGKPATELTLAEAAMLAGLPKAPSRSAPTESFERATARQHVVLDAMVDAGYITPEQRDEARAEEINVVERPNVERTMGYAFDLAVEQARALIGRTSPDLVIQMTIDSALQTAAADSIRRRLGNRAFGRRPLQAAYMALDRDGGVRALIGGTDYGTSKFNRATQARRQPGSTFKTFVYAAALEYGLDTEDVRYDEEVVIDNWRPRNYDDGFRGAVTLRTAFAQSINTVAASVGYEIGPQRVADVARRLGISNMPGRNEFTPPSISLGSIESTLWEMTSAFGTFMAEGHRLDPHIVAAVTNSAGEELYRRPPYEGPVVIDPEIVNRMNSMMGAVVIRGTGTGARLDGRDVAGKTGTSSDWRDAWFIGYT